MLFWFDSKEISESGHGFYGRYIYQLVLPWLAPQKRFLHYGSYIFFDGECVMNSDLFKISGNALKDMNFTEIIKSLKSGSCYLVSIFYKLGEVDLWAVHQHLRRHVSSCYIGMTTWRSSSKNSFQDFVDYVGQMTLPLTFMISGNTFRKESLDYLSGSELKSLGFDIARF